MAGSFGWGLFISWAAPTSSFWAFSLPLSQKFKIQKFRKSEMAASENQKYLAKLTVGIFRAGRTLAQKSETEVLENTSCEAYRAYPFSVPGTSRYEIQKCMRRNSEMVFRETDIGFSEFSIFRSRVFRAGAKKGRGWGHKIHFTLNKVAGKNT